MSKEERARAVGPVDRHVGSRMRLARKAQELSQQALAAHLGITFQQLQKYEKGINRISASRLHQAAAVLNVPLSFFFPDPAQPATPGTSEPPQPPQVADMIAFLNTSEGQAIVMALSRISDPRVRRRVTELVRSLADISS